MSVSDSVASSGLVRVPLVEEGPACRMVEDWSICDMTVCSVGGEARGDDWIQEMMEI